MIKLKKTLLYLLAMAGITTLCACNLATIETPLNKQKLYFEPIEVVVSLEDNAIPETFQALLNLNDISDRFELTGKVIKAQIGPEDGLRVFEEGGGGSIYLQGANTLVTKVMGESGTFDIDSSLFFVKAGNIVTTRDDKGVWFITGPEDAEFYDIFEAMGYAVATDRLFQLELFRRQGCGRLAEILGEGMVGTDTYIRTMGYSDDELQGFFDALDPEPKAAIQGYVDGINRRISDIRKNTSHLPLEFVGIGALKLIKLDWTRTLTDWTVIDLLGWITLLQRNFDPEAMSQREISNAALFQELADNFPTDENSNGYPDYIDMFEDLRWINDPDALTYIPGSKEMKSALMEIAGQSLYEETFPDLRQVADNMAEIRNNVVEGLKNINAYVKMGSYAWVVSGDKTLSGNPIIYSGPQMGFSVPSIILEGSIRAGGINASGMTVAGIPVMLIGRTPHHAWSMQVGHANTVDYYIEDPADVFLHRTETIKVLGKDDVLLPIYRTSHGPVISPMPYDPATYDPISDGPIISWKYSHWGHELDGANGFLKLIRATDMDEFGEGIELIPVSFHICYADSDGNIAYWMTGRDPVRPEGEWRFPQGFLGLPLEWDSEILIGRSTDRNTTQGFYSGWNNKSNPEYDSPYGPFHRAQVIHDYLSTHNNLTFEDVRDLALNIATSDSFGGGGNPWKFVETYFTNVVNANSTPERAAALAIMASWDGHFVDGGETQWAWGTDRADAWVLMNKWLREVISLTFEDELGTSQSKSTLFNVLLHGLPGTTIINNYNWFQNADPGAPQTADEIIITALDNVLAELGEPPWGIDARGEITYKHSLLGEVHTMPFSSRSTYAQCVEYGTAGPVRIESMFPLGESGNILLGPWFAPVFDPNFFSMTPVFDGFAHREFPLFD